MPWGTGIYVRLVVVPRGLSFLQPRPLLYAYDPTSYPSPMGHRSSFGLPMETPGRGSSLATSSRMNLPWWFGGGESDKVNERVLL